MYALLSETRKCLHTHFYTVSKAVETDVDACSLWAGPGCTAPYVSEHDVCGTCQNDSSQPSMEFSVCRPENGSLNGLLRFPPTLHRGFHSAAVPANIISAIDLPQKHSNAAMHHCMAAVRL